MPLKRLSQRSLFLSVALAIVATIVAIITAYATYSFFHEKAKIMREMERDAREGLVYLDKNLLPFIESYAVGEYENLIMTEMEHLRSHAIVVDDEKMAKILGQSSYVVGKIRDSQGHIVDFDSNRQEHLQQLEQCFYRARHAILSGSGDKLGVITICMTDEPLNQKKTETIRTTLFSAIFVSIFTVAAVLMVLHHLLFRPVEEIISVVSRGDKYGIPTQPIPHYEAREMAILSHSMNKMIASIRRSQAELRDLNTNLEERVLQQTEELRSHIEDLGRANQELTLAKEQAMGAATARTEFISNVSHELRTPLNAIINFSDVILEDFESMLEDKELQEDAQEYLRRIHSNSHHLLSLINDILDFSKIEANKVELDIECADIVPLLSQVHANCRPDAEKLETIDYRLSLPEDPVPAYIDRRRLAQVVYNLLSNAIKFTHEGFIELRYVSSGDENAGIIEVADTGRGIPQDRQANIFEPFAQVDRHDKGTGLGLGIVQHLCEDMDVQVELQSQEGQGTTFRLILPDCPKEAA